MRQDWERLGRRLRAEHAKQRRAVGSNLGGATLMLWEGWSERQQARYHVLHISFRFQCLPDQADIMARAVLGKDAFRAHRMTSRSSAIYILPFDEPNADWKLSAEPLFYPTAVRWFDSRCLASGLGHQREQEHVSRTGGGVRCLPVYAE